MLVPYEDRVTGVDLTDDELQVAQGSPVTDGDGTRRATLLLEPGTEATATLPGRHRRRSSATASTSAPPSSRSAPTARPRCPASCRRPPPTRTRSSTRSTRPRKDQAVNVEFDKPVVTYVDNFVGFPAGTPVPMGYYDREKAQWIAAHGRDRDQDPVASPAAARSST